MSATQAGCAPEYATEYATGQSDRRPWGDWTVIDCGPGYIVKRIRVVPGGILSLQRHRHRAEEWIVVAGQAQVTRGTARFDLAAGQTTHIDLGEIHRVANPGSVDMVFIEIQMGAILSEDDIERLEDSYGRS